MREYLNFNCTETSENTSEEFVMAKKKAAKEQAQQQQKQQSQQMSTFSEHKSESDDEKDGKQEEASRQAPPPQFHIFSNPPSPHIPSPTPSGVFQATQLLALHALPSLLGLHKGHATPRAHERGRRLSAILGEVEQLTAKKQIEFGMVPKHFASLAAFAIANDMIIMYRPVNPDAIPLLAAGGTKGKTLGTKGKSSEFFPIAGYIPFQAALSKLLLKDFDEIDKFQRKNNSALDKCHEQIEKMEEELENAQKESGEIAQSLREKVCQANSLGLVEAVAVTVQLGGNNAVIGMKVADSDDAEHVLHFIPTGDKKESDEEDDITCDNVLRDSDNESPLFLVNEGKNWLKVDVHGKKLVKLDGKLPGQPEPVKLLAYRQWIIDAQARDYNTVHSLATSDYDMLATATRKPFPFFLFAPQQDFTKVDETAKTVLPHELKIKDARREKACDSTMGIVDGDDKAAIVAQRVDTDYAVNHGVEVDSPSPCAFTDDPCPTITPWGYFKDSLNSEEKICQFINEQRCNGYPLYVNPRWGWIRDMAGNLNCKNKDWKGMWETHNGQLAQLEKDIDQKLEWGRDAITKSVSCLKTDIDNCFGFQASDVALRMQKLVAINPELWKAFLTDDQKNKAKWGQVQKFVDSGGSGAELEQRKYVKVCKKLSQRFAKFCWNKAADKDGELKKDIEQTCTIRKQLEALGNAMARILRLWLEPDVYYNYEDQAREITMHEDRKDAIGRQIQLAKIAESHVRYLERIERDKHIVKLGEKLLADITTFERKFQVNTQFTLPLKRLLQNIQEEIANVKPDQLLLAIPSSSTASTVSSSSSALPSSSSSSSVSSSCSSSSSLSSGFISGASLSSSSAATFFQPPQFSLSQSPDIPKPAPPAPAASDGQVQTESSISSTI